jgi:hypothetical protein
MPNASDVLVERLRAWNVDTIFGLPGDGINGVFEALRKQQDKIRLSTFGTKKQRRLWRALREIYGTSGRLHRNVRTGRDSFAQRALRREEGSCPVPRYHRPAA